VSARQAIPPDALCLQAGGKRWTARLDQPFDLSIPLLFDGAQPGFFGAEPARATALSAGSFVGDVQRGGSCNCYSYTVTPHCNGTHTECIGHVTADRVSIRDIAIEHFVPALLISVQPESSATTEERSEPPPQPGDLLITQRSLAAAVARAENLDSISALIVRSLPNTPEKRRRDYSTGELPAYFSAAAMQWIVSHGIDHLVVDLPSIDRSHDAGKLNGHRLFWGLAPGATDSNSARRRNATLTEMAYIEEAIPDGSYLLNLQVAPFMADAAPSRPILYPSILESQERP
jgi:kynurenine formamidase